MQVQQSSQGKRSASPIERIEAIITKKRSEQETDLFQKRQPGEGGDAGKDQDRSSSIDSTKQITKESTILLKDIYNDIQNALHKYDKIIQVNQENKSKSQKVIEDTIMRQSLKNSQQLSAEKPKQTETQQANDLSSPNNAQTSNQLQIPALEQAQGTGIPTNCYIQLPGTSQN